VTCEEIGMAFLRGFVEFWYDFIIGDDWKIATAVVLVLGIGAGVVLAGPSDAAFLPPLLGLLFCAEFVTTMFIDTRAG
jgi:hypothetical protein